MYERFTERAKKLIVHARTEAKRLNSDFVRTEHMLLGLVRERDGVAARALENLGVDLDDLQRGIEQQSYRRGSQAQPSVRRHRTYSARVVARGRERGVQTARG